MKNANYRRKIYELVGFDIAWAYSNLHSRVDFGKEVSVYLPGACRQQFQYQCGHLKLNPNIRISLFQRGNRGRFVVRYKEGENPDVLNELERRIIRKHAVKSVQPLALRLAGE